MTRRPAMNRTGYFPTATAASMKWAPAIRNARNVWMRSRTARWSRGWRTPCWTAAKRPGRALADIELAHGRMFVAALRGLSDGLRDEIEASGPHPRKIDPDTSINIHTWDAALRSAGAAIAATDAVLAGELENALLRAPARPTMPAGTRPWASASSTTSRSPRGMRWAPRPATGHHRRLRRAPRQRHRDIVAGDPAS